VRSLYADHRVFCHLTKGEKCRHLPIFPNSSTKGSSFRAYSDPQLPNLLDPKVSK
jgi:hypothetical protein